MTARVPDQAARDVAATSFDRNLVVVAGAGSGKTTLLVTRLLNLLLGKGLALPEIVALTFTEKAAAEMRERLASELSRVLEILDGASPGEDPASWSHAWLVAAAPRGAGASPDVVRARAVASLADLDGGSIGTIHAWCSDLLRRHPASAGLDPGFTVDDGTRAARLLDEEWTRFEAETLVRGSTQEQDWRLVLSKLDASVVREAAAQLVDLPVDPVPGEARARERLLSRAEALRGDLRRAEALATNPRAATWASRLDAALAAYAGGGALAVVASLAEPLPTASLPAPGKGCEDAAFVTDALRDAHALATALAGIDEDRCRAILRLALELASRLRERLAAEGVVTFQGLLVGARDLLRSSLAVRRREQARIRALLLDEFQDTDPIQYEIAFLLAEDPELPVPEGGDPWTASLRAGRLFVVGDPKQSIYRFRGADMAACERAVSVLEAGGASVLQLSANFRSRREVLEPINVLCHRIIREEHPYQPRHEPLVAARPDADAGEPRVEIWTVQSGDAGAPARRLAEGRAVASEIRSLRAAGAIASHGDVALLFRAMTNVAPYQRALSEAGVPFVTQGGKGFVDRDEIVHAMALLRVLVDPHDAASLVAILRSPSCGASDAEIARFAELSGRRWHADAHRRIPAERHGEIPRVVRTLRGLELLAAEVRPLPSDEAIRVALSEPRGAGEWHPHLVALHAAAHGGAQRLANLEKLVSRSAALAREEGLSLRRVVDRLWSELRAGSEQGESPLADEAVDAVRVMSIHQCKGLEFPVVFMPDLARIEASWRRVRDTEIAARDGMVAARFRGPVLNAASLLLEQEDRRHDEAEAARLIYVALTRARERLVLVNGDARPRKGAWPYEAIRQGWGYEAGAEDVEASLAPGVVHRHVELPEEPHEGGDAAGVGELAAAVLAGDEAARRLHAALWPRAQSPSGLKEQARAARLEEPDVAAGRGPEETARVATTPRADGVLARAVGVAVHAALEAGTLEEPAMLVAFGRRASALAAADAGADAAEVEPRAARLLEALPGADIARALASSRVLARELPFLLERDGQAWQGFVDLVVERDGVVTVVDWKTDAAVDPERHRAQLTLYAEAVRRWLGLERPPRMALAYLATGAWVEMEA